MDPLSIFVGTLTILGTANSIRQRLLKYRGRSKRLNRLLNEINHVENIFQRIREASPDAGQSHLELESLLSEANQILLELHQLIEYRLTEAGGSNQVDTWQWILHVKELDEYLDRLNVIRNNLSDLMGAVTLSITKHNSVILQRLDSQQQRVMCVFKHFSDSYGKVQENLKIFNHIHQPSHSSISNTLTTEHDVPLHKEHTINTTYMQQNCSTHAELEPSHAALHQACCCSCHRLQLSWLLTRLSAWLGSGFVEATGTFPFQKQCTATSCSSAKAGYFKIQYVLPSWFIRRVFFLHLTSSPLYGRECLIRFPLSIQYDNPLLQALDDDDVEEFCNLAEEGYGSPRDVDQDGNSLMARAIYKRRYSIIDFLLAIRLDPYYENAGYFGNCVDLIWRCVVLDAPFCPFSSAPDTELLSKIDWHRYSLAKRFTRLHCIVCGLEPDNLHQEAKLSPRDINRTDIYGRTPIWYAAMLGKTDEVRTLLNLGCSLETSESPLQAAIKFGKYDCAKILLPYVAQITVQQLNDFDPLSSHFRSGWYDPMTYLTPPESSLPYYGLAGDFAWGLKACGEAVTIDKHLWLEKLRISQEIKTSLIGQVVDIEEADEEGFTILHHAIIHSDSLSFSRSIQCGVNLKARTFQGQNVLHLAASESVWNIPFMHAMETVDLNEIDPEERDNFGFSAFDYLEKRAKANHATLGAKGASVRNIVLAFDTLKNIDWLKELLGCIYFKQNRQPRISRSEESNYTRIPGSWPLNLSS